MKRKLALLLVALMIILPVLTSCSSKTSTPAPADELAVK